MHCRFSLLSKQETVTSEKMMLKKIRNEDNKILLLLKLYAVNIDITLLIITIFEDVKFDVMVLIFLSFVHLLSLSSEVREP